MARPTPDGGNTSGRELPSAPSAPMINIPTPDEEAGAVAAVKRAGDTIRKSTRAGPNFDQLLSGQGSEMDSLTAAQQAVQQRLNTPPALVGVERLMERLKQPPSYAMKPYSAEWDKWLLTLPMDPSDPAYNDALAREQAGAYKRERGGNGPGFVFDRNVGNNPSGPDTGPNARDEAQGLVKDAKAAQLQKRRPYGAEPSVVNAYGEEVNPRKVMQLTGGTKPGVQDSMTGAYVQSLTADENGNPTSSMISGGVSTTNQGPIDAQTLMRTGKVVYVGNKTYKGAYGAEITQPQYMSIDDASLLPAAWAPQDVAAFQKLTKTKVTGYMDGATQKKWADVVDVSNYYTTRGVPLSPENVLQLMAVGGGGGSSGGGGGGGGKGGGGGRRGGGGGGGGVSSSAARAYLNSVMQKYVGRDANDAEAAAYAGAVGGAGGDVASWTIEWVKSRVPSEVGSYQAGVDYYQALMQVLQGGAP